MYYNHKILLLPAETLQALPAAQAFLLGKGPPTRRQHDGHITLYSLEDFGALMISPLPFRHCDTPNRTIHHCSYSAQDSFHIVTT
jgi:hypothetical protein